MTRNVLDFWRSLDSDDLFEALFLAAPMMLHSVGKDGRYLQVSTYLAEKLGYTVDEMLDQPILNFLTDESRAYAAKISIPEFREEGRADSIEYDYLRKDGRVLPIVTSAIAEYDESGEFVRSLAISFDNTAAKKINLDLQRKSKGEVMGELVGGVAHDFNNLLAVVQGNLNFLRQNPDHPERELLIDDAFEATGRGASIIEQLRTFGESSENGTGSIDVFEVIRTTRRLVQRLFPSNIDIQINADDDLWTTSADRALLETAILNILNNARDAMPEGGQIWIEASNFKLGTDISDHQLDLKPGCFVRIAISDTGTGIEGGFLPRVFEPFVTTKAQKGGSGLGLSMVMGFAEKSRGTIQVTSEPGVGTTFSMYLPVDASDVTSQAAVQQRHQPLLREKTVLIVEDDSSVRSILVRQLKDDNIKIFEAKTGDAAFKAMRDGLKPDLLLTDMAMPGNLQGLDLVQRARALLPKLPVVFVSGYPPELASPADITGSRDVHLTKPISQDRLRAAVMDLLMET